DEIRGALENTRDIDLDLVDAEETRRVLDRLVGYELSPLLWRKIAPRLSAGRVQSRAVRLHDMRERERLDFVAAQYWDLTARLASRGAPFTAELTHVAADRVAQGRDFDPATGRLRAGAKGVVLLGEAAARSLASAAEDAAWRVLEVEEKEQSRSPAPPFTTSTLQQEASRKLGLSARETMRVAQRLYENGLITYMRTDSTNLSEEAIAASRRAVEQRYGREYLSPQPRQFANKVRNAQEAHEAIRPAGQAMKTRDELGLTGIDAALYDLIWKRTVASQMANARLRMVTARIDAGEGDETATFRASGRTIEFAGFFRAYVEGTDDPEAALEDRDQPLPPLQKGDRPQCRRVDPLGHETKPPARYTAATLVKVLEQEGIGRPSTYASVIDTIVDRGYVFRQGNQLVPTFTAFAANNVMEEQFQQLVDMGFTAEMEQILDDIAAGERKPTTYLRSFYRGESGLEPRVRQALDAIDARKVSTVTSPKWDGLVVRVG